MAIAAVSCRCGRLVVVGDIESESNFLGTPVFGIVGISSCNSGTISKISQDPCFMESAPRHREYGTKKAVTVVPHNGSLPRE